MNDFEMRSMAENYKKLEARIAKLEAYQEYRKHFLSLNEGAVIFKTQHNAASIVMKKDGGIQINCRDFEVNASGRISLRASGDMTLKGVIE